MKHVLKCVHCNYLRSEFPHDSVHCDNFKSHRFCIQCGEFAGWTDTRAVWQSNSVWWKPWTWLDGEWIE